MKSKIGSVRLIHSWAMEKKIIPLIPNLPVTTCLPCELVQRKLWWKLNIKLTGSQNSCSFEAPFRLAEGKVRRWQRKTELKNRQATQSQHCKVQGFNLSSTMSYCNLFLKRIEEENDDIIFCFYSALKFFFFKSDCKMLSEVSSMCFHMFASLLYFSKPWLIRSLLPGEISGTGRSTQAKDYQKKTLTNINHGKGETHEMQFRDVFKKTS